MRYLAPALAAAFAVAAPGCSFDEGPLRRSGGHAPDGGNADGLAGADASDAPDTPADADDDSAGDASDDAAADVTDDGDDDSGTSDGVPGEVPQTGSILINETYCGLLDWVELVNPNPFPVDLTGWTLGLGTASGYQEHAFPSATIIGPGSFLQLLEGAGTDTADIKHTGLTVGWTEATPGEVVLQNEAGRGADYVSFRHGAGAGPSKPTDLAWSGAVSPVGDSVYRNRRPDGDTALDWSVNRGKGSPRAYNPGQ